MGQQIPAQNSGGWDTHRSPQGWMVTWGHKWVLDICWRNYKAQKSKMESKMGILSPLKGEEIVGLMANRATSLLI